MKLNLLPSRIALISVLLFLSIITQAQTSDVYLLDSIIDAVDNAENVYRNYFVGTDETIAYAEADSYNEGNYIYYYINRYGNTVRQENYEQNQNGELDLLNYLTYEYEDNNPNIRTTKQYKYGNNDWYLAREYKWVTTVTSSSYSSRQLYCYEYDERGDYTSITDNSEVVYDVKGYPISGTFYTQHKGGDSYKYIYTPTYNASRQLTRTDVVLDINGKSEKYMRYSRVYDERGNITKITSLGYNNGVLSNNQKFEYTYDESDRVTSYSMYNFNSGKWVGILRQEKLYDEQDRTTQSVNYIWVNNKWQGDYKIESTYYSDYQHTQQVYEYDATISNWCLNQKYIITNNEFGKVANEKVYEPAGDTLQLTSDQTYYYSTFAEKFDQLATSIQSPTINHQSSTLNPQSSTFTLQGVRVEGPLTPGIYIQNGKKVLIK